MELFAIAINPTRVAQFMVNCLAIGGGFLLGYVLTWIAARLLERLVFRRSSPAELRQGFCMLGGLALALLVGLIVFGHGEGWTLMGGGLEGTANQTGPTDAGPLPAPDRTVPPPLPPPATTVASDERVRVTMLGGTDVREQRFYQLDDDPQPLTLAELKTKLQHRKETALKPMSLEIRFASRNRLPTDHPAVGLLTRWAREIAGLPVTFPAEE